MGGWYGGKCSRQCTGHCREGATCNHVTGKCDGGCDKGWTGVICETGSLSCFLIQQNIIKLVKTYIIVKHMFDKNK